MADKRIGTKATPTEKTVWPEETLAGRPFNPHTLHINYARCGISDTEFVVIPFGMATHVAEDLLATLGKPAKASKAKDSE